MVWCGEKRQGDLLASFRDHDQGVKIPMTVVYIVRDRIYKALAMLKAFVVQRIHQRLKAMAMTSKTGLVSAVLSTILICY